MDGRGYGSGFSNWGGGGPGSRGIHADAVIAKINERLDMLSQLEGGRKGDRYDQYESMDSRTSMASSRDLYRSGSYGYGDGRGDNMLLTHHGGSGYGGGMGMGSGAGFDDYSSYGVAKMRQNMRESFSGGQGPSGGWASAGHRSPRRGGSAGGRGAAGGFSRGHSPGGGRGKLPSLLSNRMYPESGGFHQGLGQGPQHFPGRHFGGGPRAGRQRGRKRPLNKQVKPPKEKKPKMAEGDEPESKESKTESTEGDAASAASEQQDKNGHGEDSKAAEDTAATEGAEKAEPEAGESGQGKKSPAKKPSAQTQHLRQRKRRGFVDRLGVMFACSVCKYRSFYKEDMETHINSRFHKDHFKFLTNQLSKQTTDFLQEYLQNKLRKTEYRVGQMENHSAAICQLFRDQDLTRDLGLEHFMKKVEAAHCAACDLFIPMQLHLIQGHLKSPDHNYNRKVMMEQSKRAGLSIARSILNHKLISKKLESYLKGENPFFDNPEEQEADDSVAMDVSGAEASGEQADSQPLEGLLPSEVLEGEPEGGQLAAEGEATSVAEGATEEATEGALEGASEEALDAAPVPEEEHMEGAEGTELPPEEEGFELGDEEDSSYVVQDEFTEGLDLGEGPAADAE